jgi:hypothetical protein
MKNMGFCEIVTTQCTDYVNNSREIIKKILATERVGGFQEKDSNLKFKGGRIHDGPSFAALFENENY